MKYTSSFGMLCLVALSACGQVHDEHEQVSAAVSSKVKLYERKSSSYQDKKPDSAIYFANQGLKLSRSLHYQLGEGILLNRLARINEQYGNLKLAVKYQKEALNIFSGLHHPLAIDATADLGTLIGLQGDLKSGNSLIRNALARYEKIRDIGGIIKADTKLGQLCELNGNPGLALQYYSRAERLNNGKPVSDEYFKLISHIGNLHAGQGNYRQAIDYFEKGISKSDSDEHIKAHIAFLNNAGKNLDKLGEKQKALSYHQRGLQKAKANGLHEEEARSLMSIASVLKDQDAEQSIRHLKNALVISHAIGHKQLTAEIYSSLSDLYRQQSRYQEALTALEEHHRLLDSLQNATEGHKIEVLQGSYELAESKLHIESLKLSNEQRTEERNAGMIAAAAILLILFILTIYYYNTRRLNERLVSSNLIKDKLFSIIGHDLRNPIGGITQLLAMMDEGDLTSEEHQQMISQMRKQGDITLEILNALLSWGESQLKGIHIKPSEFNAKQSIYRNIEALHEQAIHKSILITDSTPSELIIYGDINHFEFIIRNLLSNAIKFSHPSGTIEIAADLRSGTDEVIFSVRDHGKGISVEQQKAFLKANLDVSFGTKGEKGTGIGLMLSREFIKASGRKLWMESEEGKGTAFYFTFSRQAGSDALVS